MDAKEGLAKGDENGDMKDRIWRKVVKLQTINKKQSAEKRMNGGGKTANEVVDKAYPVPHWRGWIALLTGEA